MKGKLYQFNRDDAFRFATSINAETFPRGNELHFKYCPYCGGGQHRDKKTFSINLTNGTYNCKRGSCGVKGNMITLAQDFSEFSLGDGIDDYYLHRERFKKFKRQQIVVKDAAIEYLKKRAIPEEITKRYEVTIHKNHDNVLVFPFKDENDDVWFIKYRDVSYVKGESNGNKEWCEKGRKPILFGMNHCNYDNRTLVMTEGQIDSLSCAAAGVENAVSVPIGKNGFTWYPYCFNFLGRFDELIVFGDYENGEISLLNEMQSRFHGIVKHVRTEDYKDCKDANEILIKYGVNAIQACIENAVPVPVSGLMQFKNIQRVNLDDLDKMQTGIRELDRLCPFYFGELIVLTGAAGDGKSTLASQWAAMAIDQGYPTMIYSGEMPEWLVKNWIDYQLAGKNNLNARNALTDEIYEKIESSSMYRILYAYDEQSGDDERANDGEERLFSVIKQSIQQHGIRFIIIDNLMTAMDCVAGLELNEAQTIFTKRLAKIAQERNVIIILVVHPRKNKYGTFSNDDIAGSSNIVNRAHKTIRYSRPDEKFTDLNGKTWENEQLLECPIRMLTVLKDRMTGHTIRKGIPLYFEESTKRISDSNEFTWRYSWEHPEDGFNNLFETDDEYAEIPF